MEFRIGEVQCLCQEIGLRSSKCLAKMGLVWMAQRCVPLVVRFSESCLDLTHGAKPKKEGSLPDTGGGGMELAGRPAEPRARA